MLIVIAGPYEKRLALRSQVLSGRSHLEELEPDPESLREKAAEGSLFGETRVYMLRNAAEEEDIQGLFQDLSRSPHLFVLEEEKVLVKVAALIKKHGGVLHEAKAAEKKEWINSFVLADALGNRDRKQIWVLLMTLLRNGAKPEELAGVLHWQARSMLLASRAASAEDIKMKEFVFTKSRRYAKNYSEKELRELSAKLVTLYHESHRGGGPLELLLERFALSL